MLVAFFPPLIVVHELAHASVAKLIGLSVPLIRIGAGREILRFRAAGTWVHVNLVPTHGLTMISARTTAGLRKKTAVALAAGPGVNVALALICWAVIGSEVFRPPGDPQSVVASGFFFANLWLAAINLFPFTGRTRFGGLPSDGLHLLRLSSMEDQDLEDNLVVESAVNGQELMFDGRWKEAAAVYDEALARWPDNFTLRFDRATVYLETGRFREARAILSNYLDPDALPEPQLLPMVQNNFAYAVALDPAASDSDRAEALALVSEAIKTAPAAAALVGTLGSLRVRVGDVDEGLQLLERAHRGATESRSRGTTALWMALGEAMRGDAMAAEDWLEQARGRIGSEPTFRTIEGEIRQLTSRL